MSSRSNRAAHIKIMANIIRKKHTGESGNGGQFGTGRHGGDEVALADKVWSMNPFYYSGVGMDTVDRFPRNATEARAALRNVRGEPNGGIRAVFLNDHSAPEDPEVYGPADGRPLIILVNGGMIRLNVISGNVVVHSGSWFGNVVRTSGDATATIIAGPGRKVSTEATGQSNITILPGEGARGLGYSEDDAHITIVDMGVKHGIQVRHRFDL